MDSNSTVLQGTKNSTSRYVAAGRLRLHYLEQGRGKVNLVIVPGITSPASTWKFVARELAADYHVYTLDNRGRGLSDRPPTGYRLPDYTVDLSDFLEQLALEQPIVILGHSMGARIAASFVVSHPKKVSGLILADPPVSGPGRVPYPYPLDFYLEQIRKARDGITIEELRPFLPTWKDEQLQDRVEWLATCDERAIIESYQGLNEEDFFYFWAKINMPLLLVYGKDSIVLPESAVTELREMNPAAKVAAIANAGHMIPWDNLADFLAAIRQFMPTMTNSPDPNAK